MVVRPKRDDWTQDIYARQHNVLLHDQIRNAPRFWGGLRYQKLNLMQWIGLLAVALIYIGVFVLVASESWPSGTAPVWQKILYGYGPYVLLSLPLVFVLLVIDRRFRRKR
jgi:hypothetical protein